MSGDSSAVASTTVQTCRYMEVGGVLGNMRFRTAWLVSMGACLCTLLLAVNAVAASLAVQVVDCELNGCRDGVPGATVRLTQTTAPTDGSVTSPGGTGKTDADGLATFANLGGEYTVTVTCSTGTFTKTIYIHPQLQTGHDVYLVIECCKTFFQPSGTDELDYWDHNPGNQENWEKGFAGRDVVKTDWKRAFADLHVRLVDCNGNPFPLPFLARLTRTSPTPPAFSLARQAGAGGDAVYRMLALGAYTLSVRCPPSGSVVSATVTPAANTTTTVVFKCPATTCGGLRPGQSWGGQRV